MDNIRVAKLLGGGLHNCTIVRGMVLKSDAVGTIKQVEKAKVSGNISTVLILFFHKYFSPHPLLLNARQLSISYSIILSRILLFSLGCLSIYVFVVRSNFLFCVILEWDRKT